MAAEEMCEHYSWPESTYTVSRRVEINGRAVVYTASAPTRPGALELLEELMLKMREMRQKAEAV